MSDEIEVGDTVRLAMMPLSVLGGTVISVSERIALVNAFSGSSQAFHKAQLVIVSKAVKASLPEESQSAKPELKKKSVYHMTIKGQQIDVYDVLLGFGVTCPAMQHAIKKALMPGLRGVKSPEQDKREAINSIERSIELAKRVEK